MALVAREIEFILKRLECSVVGPVAALDDAMQLVRDAPPDGVILDVNLNGIESYPLAGELQERSIPFVLTTGYGAGSIPAKFHAVPRLEKPFGMDDLEKQLNALFAIDQ